MRLTNSLKEEIVHNAQAKAGYFLAVESNSKKYEELAVDIFNAAFGGVEERQRKLSVLEKAKKLIEGTKIDTVCVQEDKRRDVRCEVMGQIRYFDLPFKDAVVKPTLKIGMDHPLAKRIEELDAETDRLRELRYSVRNSVMAILNSVTTVKKLVIVWPEAEELLPKESQLPQKTNLPAIQIESVNALIGLPSN